MQIKKILTTLLLLSFAPGLYNPIKATSLMKQAVQIHVFEKNSTMDNQIKIIKSFTAANQNNHQQTGLNVDLGFETMKKLAVEDSTGGVGFLVELTKEYIDGATTGLPYFNDLLLRIKNAQLEEFTMLFITGYESEEEASNGLQVKSVSDRDLFCSQVWNNPSSKAGKLLFSDKKELSGVFFSLRGLDGRKLVKTDENTITKGLSNIPPLHLVLDFYGLSYSDDLDDIFIFKPDQEGNMEAFKQKVKGFVNNNRRMIGSISFLVTPEKINSCKKLLDNWLSNFKDVNLPQAFVIIDEKSTDSGYEEIPKKFNRNDLKVEVYDSKENFLKKCEQFKVNHIAYKKNITLGGLLQQLDITSTGSQWWIPLVVIGILSCIVYNYWDKCKSWLNKLIAFAAGGATSAASAEVDNSAQPSEVSAEMPGKPALEDATNVSVSNSSNQAGWGFKEWLLLIMAMILILGGVYWYISIEQKA